MSDLKDFLLQRLNEERDHVLATVEGLSDEQMRQVLVPSGWSCMTMIKHMEGHENYWFRCIVDGESFDLFDTDEWRNQGEWKPMASDTGADLIARYKAAIEHSNEVLARKNLEDAPAQRDPEWGDWDVPDVRFIVTHSMSEHATHAGHLDIIRELIDGKQYLVLE